MWAPNAFDAHMEMVGSLDHMGHMLEKFEQAQDEDSDDGNEAKIEHAKQELENLRGAIEDLVP